MPKEVETVVFVICCILLFLLFLLLFVYPVVRNYLYDKWTIRFYYERVRQVVDEYDLFLINEWNVQYGAGKEESVHIDHLIVGDRYIYLVRDRYFKGAVKGDIDDESWQYFSRARHKKIANPLKQNETRLTRFSSYSQLDPNFFVTVVLVNDDAYFELDQSYYDNHYIVSLSKFEKFIRSFEEDSKTPKFNKEDMARLVKDLAKIKNNGK